MKLIILVSVLAIMSCCGSRATNEKDKEVNDVSLNAAAKDSLPGCINELIQRFQKEEIQNPPRKIYSYQYKGSTVYYVTPPCCDFFSELYDNKCNLLGHPDGGITGKGDGKLADFTKLKLNETLVWEDNRSPKSKQ
jgi:hypothetical protein